MKWFKTGNYVEVLFAPYVIVVVIATLSLMSNLLPNLFPGIKGSEIIISVIEAVTTLLGVALGWTLALKQEERKEKLKLAQQLNAILEEIRDLEPTMLNAQKRLMKSALDIKTENRCDVVNVLPLPQYSPAYDEHFKYVIPDISAQRRRNIRNVYGHLLNFNYMIETLKSRLGRGSEPIYAIRDIFLCSVCAGKIAYMCRWVSEQDADALLDFESDFFEAHDKEVEQNRESLFKAN